MKIKQLEDQTKAAEKKMLVFKDSNQYIKMKIEEISSLIYDEQTWGHYLHSISINAKRNNIKILNFTNEYVDNTEAFGHILNISISTRGSYKNTINFINSLEKSELVVDVHDLSLQAQNQIDSQLDISVWGITY